MMSELCYAGQLIESGRYVPDGEEYFAEAVAFVPRSLWPDKPFIAIDYAIARGFYDARSASLVSATMAPGMIGQGVINYGPVFGPIVAAALTAIWAGILSRMWVQRARPERSALFLIGMALTINMGRGVSLLALFPFVFAYAGVLAYEILRPPPPVVARRPAAERVATGTA
jgi:hypothetical protein